MQPMMAITYHYSSSHVLKVILLQIVVRSQFMALTNASL